MVDVTTDSIEKLPPEERLRQVRELEAEKRKTEKSLSKQKKSLEEELAKKKKELEELEKKTKKEIEEAEDLEEKTLDEITRERAKEVKDLEKRIKKFQEGGEFLPASHETMTGVAPLGFDQTGGALYQSPIFQQAQESIDYLLNAQRPSERAMVDAERDLYRSVRSMAESVRQGSADESYTFNKIHEEVERLKNRDDDQHGYIARIEKVLNSIIDYKAEAERQQYP